MQRRYVGLRVALAGSFLFFNAFPAGAEVWTVGPRNADFQTIQEAVDAAQNGDTIQVLAGSFEGATVDKAVTVQGTVDKRRRLVSIIRPPKSNPLGAGFMFNGFAREGSNASIKNLNFQRVAFPVYSLGADNVTVDNNTMVSPVQAITNWNGQKWLIQRNTISSPRSVPVSSDNATAMGGTGIVIGSGSGLSTGFAERHATVNTVKFNKITGKVTVARNAPNKYAMAAVALVDKNPIDSFGVMENVVDNNTISLSLVAPRTRAGTPSVKLQGIMLNEQGSTEVDSVVGNVITNNTIYNDVPGGGRNDGISAEDALAEKPLIDVGITKANTYGTTADHNANVSQRRAELYEPREEAQFDLSLF